MKSREECLEGLVVDEKKEKMRIKKVSEACSLCTGCTPLKKSTLSKETIEANKILKKIDELKKVIDFAPKKLVSNLDKLKNFVIDSSPKEWILNLTETHVLLNIIDKDNTGDYRPNVIGITGSSYIHKTEVKEEDLNSKSNKILYEKGFIKDITDYEKMQLEKENKSKEKKPKERKLKGIRL